MKRTHYSKKSSNSLKYILISLPLLIIFILAYIAYSLFDKPIESSYVKVKIPNGATVSQSISFMNDNDALKPKWLFSLVAKLADAKYNSTIKAGLHKLPGSLSNLDLLKALFTGEYLYNKRITFPEGISYKRFASILSHHLEIDSTDFVNLCISDSLLNARNISAKSVEGYLHPATFSFDLDISASDAIDKLLDASEIVWQERFSSKQLPNGMNKHQVLTLASIVEAESPVADERPRVAGVYINRLNKNMLLQADPTVQYALGAKKRVLYADLNIDNPYNTYKYQGLPPGPINSPSVSAIDAVFNYERHNYLFFVAVGDGSGRHNFARNFDEHRRFVSIFRKNVRK